MTGYLERFASFFGRRPYGRVREETNHDHPGAHWPVGPRTNGNCKFPWFLKKILQSQTLCDKMNDDMKKAVNGPPYVGFAFSERAGWCDPLSVQHRAFSREPPPEPAVGCAAGPALWVNGVSAPKKRAEHRRMRVVPRKQYVFRPKLMGGKAFSFYKKGDETMKQQLEEIKQRALAALDAADSPAALE